MKSKENDLNLMPPDVHILLAASSYLMTRYSLSNAEETARGVVDHLKMLLDHPDIQSSKSAMVAYSNLLYQWKMILTKHQRPECNNISGNGTKKYIN